MDQWNNGEGGGYFGGNEVGTPSQSVTSAPRQQFLCPVTVRQILESPEQGLKVGSLTATMVSLCGVVSNIESTSTTIKFGLADDTGMVDCLEWLETQVGYILWRNITAHSSANLTENKYYHVYGCIKFPQGKRRIMVFKIIEVKDFNEITAFMLEVLSAHEYAEKVPKESKVDNMNVFGQNPLHNVSNSLNDDKDRLTPIQKVLLAAIAAVQNPVGWSKNDNKIVQKYSSKEIQDTLDKLVSEGHIYSTIDDDHFCCT